MEIKGSIRLKGLRTKDFRLLSLELQKNSLMGKSSLYYEFNDDSEGAEGIYTTVIIGPNGTGKSNLFRIIIEILKELYDLSIGREKSLGSISGRYRLIFSLNNEIYRFGNILDPKPISKYDFQASERKTYRRNPILFKNDERIKFSEFNYAITIVANAITLHDKYPFYRQIRKSPEEKEKAFPFYKYLGVRNTPQGTSTRAYVRRTVKYIVEQKDSSVFMKGLHKTTEFLGLAESLEVIYTTSNTKYFFRGDLNVEKLQRYFEDIEVRYSEKPTRAPQKLGVFKKIANDIELLNQICQFINKLISSERLKSKDKKITMTLKYDILNNYSFKEFQSEFKLLEKIYQLGILSTPDIKLKREEGFLLQESSSGEYHFLSTIVGLLATVKENSLVLIDEPEISLHPNWQMKYLSFLREMFSGEEYKSVHLLVATHSHFLISDLRGDSSKIIGLKREDSKIKTVDLPHDLNTFGWSAEEVLYRVFNVRSTRNSFLEYDLTKLVTMVNKNSKDFQEIRRIVDKISTLILSDNDPLKILKEKAEKYLDQNHA
jgi:predicted ATPase